MKLKKNKFLIVGGTGFIGSALARELVKKIRFLVYQQD